MDGAAEATARVTEAGWENGNERNEGNSRNEGSSNGNDGDSGISYGSGSGHLRGCKRGGRN